MSWLKIECVSIAKGINVEVFIFRVVSSMSKRKAVSNVSLRRSKRINASSVPDFMLDENVWFNHVFVCLTSSQLILLGMTCKYFYHLVDHFFKFRVPALKLGLEKKLRASDLVPYTVNQLMYCHRYLGLTRRNQDMGAARKGDLQYFQHNGFERSNWRVYIETAITFNKHFIVRYFVENSTDDFIYEEAKESLIKFCVQCGNMIAFHMLVTKMPLRRRLVSTLRSFGEIACKFKQYAMFEYIFYAAQRLAELNSNAFNPYSFFNVDMVIGAAASGQEECLRLIFAHTRYWPVHWLSLAVSKAIAGNHVNIIKIIVEEHGIVVLSTRDYNTAALYGHNEVIQYLLLKDVPRSTHACKEATIGDQFLCLKFLHENGFEWNGDVLEYAIKENSTSIECLRFAFENGCRPDENSVLPRRAVESRNLEALKYCVEVMGLPLTRDLWGVETDKSITEYLKRMNCPRPTDSQP